jgi:hypothetical protein
VSPAGDAWISSGLIDTFGPQRWEIAHISVAMSPAVDAWISVDAPGVLGGNSSVCAWKYRIIVDHRRCIDICENRQAFITRHKLWTS